MKTSTNGSRQGKAVEQAERLLVVMASGSTAAAMEIRLLATRHVPLMRVSENSTDCSFPRSCKRCTDEPGTTALVVAVPKQHVPTQHVLERFHPGMVWR